MKKLLFAAALLASAFTQASDVRLVVQEMNSGGASYGRTFRVYAVMPSVNHTLQVVYGDASNPLRIESTAPFYQNQYAAFSAAGISSVMLEVSPDARFDSWITLGYENNDGNSMWDLGVNFSAFDNGGSITADNGGWFLTPADEKCKPNNDGLILLGQFTSQGTITGILNLQGLDADGRIWRKQGLRFNTNNCDVFGCTDDKASNFNPMAVFSDGSCIGGNCIAKPADLIEGEAGWAVFPNPIRENLINVQLNNMEVISGSTLDILDSKGSLVGSFVVGKTASQNGNRITVDQSLKSGTYQVVLQQNGKRETKTIVVQ
jgi:hypothetical protein